MAQATAVHTKIAMIAAIRLIMVVCVSTLSAVRPTYRSELALSSTFHHKVQRARSHVCRKAVADGFTGPNAPGRLFLASLPTIRSRPTVSSAFAPAKASACGCEESLSSVDCYSRDECCLRRSETQGRDSLYPGLLEIDPDVREEYWKDIRASPQKIDQASNKCTGRYGGKGK